MIQKSQIRQTSPGITKRLSRTWLSLAHFQHLSQFPSVPSVFQPRQEPLRDKGRETNTVSSPSSIHVFISYAHEDETWRERFMQYLKPMVEPGEFEIWADRDIEYGERWNVEIQERLGKTTHAILLVSTAFLKSEYIETKELPLLFQRHHQKDGLRIIPVLLETCLFDEQKYRFPNPKTGPEEVYLDKLQMVSVEKPLGSKSQGQQNETLHEIARYIKKNQA